MSALRDHAEKSGEPTATLAPVAAADILQQIISQLSVAISASIPSDSQIIMERVRAAHDLAVLLRRAQSDARKARTAP